MPHDDYIRIAVVTGVHGLSGCLKIMVVSDISERFAEKNSVFINIDGNYQKFAILRCSLQKGRGILELEGVEDRSTALSLKGSDIYIDKAEAERTRRNALDGESYYFYDIIGCSVCYQGKIIGRVRDILETGAGHILVIETGRGKDLMIPFVESMVDTREIRNCMLTIHPVEGLIDV
jgi:16S rRNA processing protein RimM